MAEIAVTGSTVRPDVQGFLEYLNNAGTPPMSTLTPALARQGFAMMSSVADRAPLDLPVIRDLSAPGPAVRSPCGCTIRATCANRGRRSCFSTAADS